VIAILVLSLLFIGVDMNSVATTLAESGIGTFQSPLRAWFFSMVPIGLALCLHLVAERLEPKQDRRIYAVVLKALGIMFGLVWLWFFSSTFPGIAKSSTEILNSLSLSPSAVESTHAANYLLFSGLAAAAFIAAASWVAVETIVDAHQVTRLESNPAFMKTRGDVQRLLPVLEKQGVLLERTRKLCERIDREMKDYLHEADNLYSTAEAGIAFGRDAYRRLFGGA
jgi:hypothetical protein